MIAIMSSVLFDLLARLPSNRRHFGEGAFLFHRDDPVELLHLVEEGAVHLLRHQAGGASLVLQRARAGSLLAEASLYSEHYHCDAVAIRASATRSFAKPLLLQAIARDGALAEAWAGHLARDVQAARLRAEILSMRTVAERLDAWMDLRGRGLPQRGDGTAVASEIGVSPEALYRELARRRRV